MARFQGVHHPAFATNNIDATVRYWRDLLRMRLVYTSGEPGQRQYFFEVTPGSYVVFFEWPEVEPTPIKRPGRPAKGPFSFDHLCIQLEDIEHLWELSDRLFAADFPISDTVDHGFVHSLYTYDPNGIALEFAASVPGVDVSRPHRFTESEPSAAAQEGPDPVPGHWPEPEPLPVDERIVVPGDGSKDFP